jgi:uncharacterized protein (AIM24 family)
VTNTDVPLSTVDQTCPWCGVATAHAQLTCPSCGAPLKLKPKSDDSGWIELPPIQDMARLRIGASTCQIEGEYVPVCDFNLAEGDGVYFGHHTLLWRDPSVTLQTMPLKGAVGRMLAGMPIVMTEAVGPGHIAFSADVPGEVVALPLRRGQSIHVREHVFLAATKSIAYDWHLCGAYFYTQRDPKESPETHYPVGRFLDEFVAAGDHGLLLLHGGGNVFIRELAAGEWLLIKPSAFLFKDPSVRMGMCMDMVPAAFGYQTLLWMQLVGPGRIGVQSAYPRVEAEARAITGTSGRVTGAWEQGTIAPALAAIMKPARSRARQLLTNTAAKAVIPRTPTLQRPATDYRIGIEKMISDVMVDGLLPADAMDRIEAEAEKHRLSPHDLEMLIRHVRHSKSGGG